MHINGRRSSREVWTLEILVWTCLTVLIFVRSNGSTAAEMPVKFEKEPSILTSNLGATGRRDTRQVSNIRRTLVGNSIVAHSDVAGASLVGTALTTSSSST